MSNNFFIKYPKLPNVGHAVIMEFLLFSLLFHHMFVSLYIRENNTYKEANFGVLCVKYKTEIWFS